MSGERSAFTADAFHKVAIAADGVDVEIEKLETRLIKVGCEPFRSDGHADAVGDALAQGAGGGFDAGSDMRFRVPGGAAAKLTEPFDFVHRDGKLFLDFAVFIYGADACQMQCGIEKHGGVASGEDETIAIGPQGIGGVLEGTNLTTEG